MLTSTESSGKIYGIGAEFSSAAELYSAAEQIRAAGYKKWDVHSPFPIHGMDEAMGLPKSPLGYFVFFGGAVGLMTAIALQWFTNVFDYPLVVQGKPTDLFGTLPAFFPVIFELTILSAAFTTIFGLMLLTGLPRWNHPVFEWDRFFKFSDDGFFAVIEARDEQFDSETVSEFLESLGGRNITLIPVESH
jgi:hypothetical protein